MGEIGQNNKREIRSFPNKTYFSTRGEKNANNRKTYLDFLNQRKLKKDWMKENFPPLQVYNAKVFPQITKTILSAVSHKD